MDNQCAICHDPLQEASRTLPCKHTFNADCIAQWLHKSATCPLCRAPVPTPWSWKGYLCQSEDDLIILGTTLTGFVVGLGVVICLDRSPAVAQL